MHSTLTTLTIPDQFYFSFSRTGCNQSHVLHSQFSYVNNLLSFLNHVVQNCQVQCIGNFQNHLTFHIPLPKTEATMHTLRIP